MNLFRDAGVRLEFVAKPDGEHNTRWWPAEAGKIEAFIDGAPRNPYPDEIWWRTDRADRYNRAHWVVIEELDDRGVELDEDNQVVVDGRSFIAFPRRRPSGRVVVRRNGNEIRVRALGVRSYRLLLSPDQFDLDAPITVSTNGIESFRGVAPRDAAVLMKWAARDGDRTLLFGAELLVGVEGSN